MRLACINCHGVRGKGLDPNTSMFPVIGGQHKEYIRLQLVNFRDGYRTNSPNGIMTRIADSLTDTEIESLAEYVSVQ
jgi:cytochrome c553